MPDSPQFVAARIRLNALCEHLPSFPSEKDVADYHSILADIETNSSYDLSPFRIPEDQVARQIIGAQRSSFSGRPGRTIYSTDKRCDRDYFSRQVRGAQQFLAEMGKTAQRSATDSHDYWSKSDEELIAMATAYGIACSYRSYLAGPNRSAALDRQKIIDQLLQRDSVLPNRSHGNVTVNIQGPVSGSTIQAGSPYATASVSSGIDLVALADLISKLKAMGPSLLMSDAMNQQFNLNIQTLEKEAQRSVPDRSVIWECLNATKNTLVAVGAGVASNAVWVALLHYLALHH